MPEPLRLTDGEKVAFERNGGIFVGAAPVLGNARRIGAGQDPTLSPDGALIAYEAASTAVADRHFVVQEVATGRKLHSQHGMTPHFSPDGAWIAFSDFHKSGWSALVTDSGFKNRPRPLTRPAKEPPVFIAHWTGNNLLIAYSDTLGGSLYALRPTGEVVKQVNITQIAGKNDTMQPIGCAWSDDLSRLVFEAQTGEEELWDDGGPLTGLFLYDFPTRRLRLLTPKGMGGSGPVWYGKDTVLFTSLPNQKKGVVFSLSLMNVITGEIRKLATNVQNAALCAGRSSSSDRKE